MSQKTTKAKTSKKVEAKTETKTKASMSDTLKKYRGGYVKTDGYNKQSINNGDGIASLLKMFNPEQVMTIAETTLGLKKNELAKRYDHLNPGQKRMNAGNCIRAALKRGDVPFKAFQVVAKKAAKTHKVAI